MSKQINIGGRIHSTEVGNVSVGANEVLDDTKGKKQNVINSETDAELLRLDQSKQNNLTFDNTPTENSNNPVKSSGVYAADKALSDAIEAILLLIPSAATSLNQLADKAFVNSSVSTATATFRGTYNVVTDLELAYDATHEQIATKLGQVIATADNNDYAFVQVPVSATSTDIRRTERYKFNGTVWGYEYDLNTSGFTAAQWEAINSAITATLVQKLSALPTAQELAAALLGKQDVLTFDNVPTTDSSNPVKSGGVKSAINDEKVARENADTGLGNRITAIENVIPSAASSSNKLVDNSAMADAIGVVTAIIGQMDATFNITTTDGHITLHVTQVDGVITSVQVQSSDIASAAALTLVANDLSALITRVGTAEGNITSLTGRVSTNETDIANLQQLYNDLQQSKPIPVIALPETGQQQGMIYRLAGTTSYSDYMWNGSTWVLMATYNNAIDNAPTIASNNIPKSSGVYNAFGGMNGAGSALTGFIRRIESVGEKAKAHVGSWIESYTNCTLELCFKNAGFTQTQFLMSWSLDSANNKSVYFAIGDGTIFINADSLFNLVFSNTSSLGDVVKVALNKKGNVYTAYIDGQRFNSATANITTRDSDIYIGSYIGYLAGYVTDYYYAKLTDDDTGEIVESINAGSEFVEFTSERHALGRIFRNASSGSGSELTDGDVILVGDITLNTVVTLDENTHIRGNDCIVHVGPNGKLVLGEGCSIEGVTFDGGSSVTRTQQSGEGYYNLVPLISKSDIANWETYIGSEVISILGENAAITNCRFDNIDRLCIKYDDNYMAYTVKTQPCITNNYFYNCRAGMYYKGEFGRIIGNVFNTCVYGVIKNAGNLAFSSCIFLRNDVGILQAGGSNGGHSEMVGIECAHCGIAGLYIISLPRGLGDVYSGCHFADAPIIGEDCSALLVTGSRLDCWVEIASGAANAFIANSVYKDYASRDNKPIFGGNVTYNLKVNNASGSNVADSEINN